MEREKKEAGINHRPAVAPLSLRGRPNDSVACWELYAATPCWSAGVNIRTAEWWMTVIYFYGCALIHQPPTESPAPSGGGFSRSPRRGEKQNSAREWPKYTSTKTHRAERQAFTQAPPPPWTYGNVSGSPEMLANVRTCGQLGTGPHARSLQLCRGGRGPPPCCPALPCPTPTPTQKSHHTLAPGRETNCECYWLPQQICAVRRVNKMDGLVSLSSGEVLRRGAPGRVQHRAGSLWHRTLKTSRLLCAWW